MLYSDNQSAIHLAKKTSLHSNTKHIHIKYHFIRSVLDEELLKLEKIHTSQNPIDMLTKGVTIKKLRFCWPSRMKVERIIFPCPMSKA